MLFSNLMQNEQFPKKHRAGKTLPSFADVIVYQYSLHIDYGFSESHLFRDSVIHYRGCIVSTWLLH